jgi:hypothetical protein
MCAAVELTFALGEDGQSCGQNTAGKCGQLEKPK